VQSFVLGTGSSLRVLWKIYYSLAIWCFRAWIRGRTKWGAWPIAGLYLRRTGAVGDLNPGASDLDFFLWIETSSISEEDRFLKAFWQEYRWWKKIFPPLGEVLIGQGDELALWLNLPLIRSREAFHWRALYGPSLKQLIQSDSIDPHDISHEALKIYGDALRILQRIPTNGSTFDLKHRLALRNIAKAYADLLRLKSIAASGEGIRLLGLPRKCFLQDDSLALRTLSLDPLRKQESNSLRLWLETIPTKLFQLLEDCSPKAPDTPAREIPAQAKEHQRIGTSTSFALFTLSAERLLARNPELVEVWCSGAEDQMILKLSSSGGLIDLLEDIRQLHLGFGRFGLALPLGPLAFSAYSNNGAYDLAFHGNGPFFRLQRMSRGFPLVPMSFLTKDTPRLTLERMALELGFSLRMPPEHPEHFFRKLLPSILSFRPCFTAVISPDVFESTETPKLISQTLFASELSPLSELNGKTPTDLWSNQYGNLRRELGVVQDLLFAQKTKLRM
jgi:hypothetical protein